VEFNIFENETFNRTDDLPFHVYFMNLEWKDR